MTRTLAPSAFLFAAGMALLAPRTSGVHAQAPSRDPAAPTAPLVETSAISGQVVLEGTSAAPVRRATVTIASRDPSVMRMAVTDDGGRFRVAPVPAGRYTVTVERPGFVPLRDPRAPAMSAVTVAEGQHRSDVSLRMARGAVITGRVLDRQGQPLASVAIAVAERRTVGRQVTTRQVRVPGSPGGARTDDRGVYRVFGLPAGTYVLAVTPSPSIGARLATAAELQWARQPRRGGATPAPPPGPAVTHAPVYYPATADLDDATPITVAAGEERTGVDVTFDLVATTELIGRVTWEDGQPARGVQIVAAPRERAVLSSGITPFARVQPSDATGRFSATGLLPGRYTIMARATRLLPGDATGRRGGTPEASAIPALPGRRGAPAPPAPLFWSVAEITAAGQLIDDLSLVLKPAIKISGRVVFDGAAQPPDPASVNVALSTARESAGATLRVSSRGVQPDGSFVVDGLVPGSYLLTSSVSTVPASPGASGPAGPLPARWLVKSASASGRDALDAPLDVLADREITDIVVTFTTEVTELSGRVSDSLDRPVSEYYIVAFSVDASHWRQGSRRLGTPRRLSSDGRYAFSGLPPGEYYLAAVPEFEQTIWYTPEYLEQVAAGAIKVTIGEGEKKTQDIKLGI